MIEASIQPTVEREDGLASSPSLSGEQGPHHLLMIVIILLVLDIALGGSSSTSHLNRNTATEGTSSRRILAANDAEVVLAGDATSASLVVGDLDVQRLYDKISARLPIHKFKEEGPDGNDSPDPS